MEMVFGDNQEDEETKEQETRVKTNQSNFIYNKQHQK